MFHTILREPIKACQLKESSLWCPLEQLTRFTGVTELREVKLLCQGHREWYSPEENVSVFPNPYVFHPTNWKGSF